jgi:hypothetical protein
MTDDHSISRELQPTASGILLCLRMLTEEALTLNLRRSVLALRAAALVVEADTLEDDGIPELGLRRPATADARFC